MEADGVDSAMELYTTWEIRLGSLALGWSAGPNRADAAGHLAIPVAPPSDAFLHELASDYLTDLRVRVVFDVGAGYEVEVLSPPVFLAWPDGRTGAVKVWDLPTAAVEAPLGIVDPVVRASVTDTTVTRVLAPIGQDPPVNTDPTEDRVAVED